MNLKLYLEHITQKEEQTIIDFVHKHIYEYESVNDRFVLQYGIRWRRGEILPATQSIPDFLQRIVPNANQCFINIYPPNVSIGKHIDDVSLGPFIYVLSCGEDTSLQLTDGNEFYKYKIPRRSLYILEDDIRYTFLHSTLPTEHERISITYRIIP